LVSCVDFRSPVALARAAADVDRWSNGRVVLGIGGGDNVYDEYRRMGLPLAPMRERQARLEETIQVVRGLWESGHTTNFVAGRLAPAKSLTGRVDRDPARQAQQVAPGQGVAARRQPRWVWVSSRKPHRARKASSAVCSGQA
jgi:alkanesulfonate monooxygenase SsuD/methylene tetrahydromethanopterin reductase-like flavin-dependent oxidoreductase (luciferase family)